MFDFSRVLVLLVCLTGSLFAGTFYVSPDGSDNNNGSKRRPFASLEKARDAVMAAGDSESVVLLKGGRYFRNKTLYLNASNTPEGKVVYRAVEGEQVVLDGSRILSACDFKSVRDPAIVSRLVPEVRDEVVCIDLASVDITEFGQVGPRGWARASLSAPVELFINSVPMQISRWPNEGYMDIGEVIDSGSKPRHGEMDGRPGVFKYVDKRAERWKNAKDLCVEGVFSVAWGIDIIPVAKIDTGAGTITTTVPHHYGFRQPGFMGVKTYWRAMNLLEEIDLPGEYYIDRTGGKLYLMPPHELEGSLIQISVMNEPFVEMRDVSSVWFEGITFENCRVSGIIAQDCRSVEIKGCTLRNFGKWAVQITGGSRCGLQSCDIYNMGGGGVLLSGGDRKKLVASKHYARNCDIHNVNRWDNSYLTPVKMKGVGQIAMNNHLHHTEGQAIVFNGNDHIITGNEMNHVITDMSDQAPIYAGRNPSYCGNDIRYNFIHNITNYHDGGAGNQGIFFDDAMLFPAVVFGNVFYKAGTTGVIKYNVGGGGTIANNIVVDCPPLLQGGHKKHIKRAVDRMHGVKDIHNFVDMLKQVDITSEPYKSRYPYLYKAYTDDSYKAETKVWNNYVVKNDYSQFVDAASLDFTIKDNSPVLEMVAKKVDDPVYGVYDEDIKFEKILFDQIGLLKDGYRSKIAPADFGLVYPVAGVEIKNSQPIEFVWQPSHNADSYNLIISSDAEGKKIVKKVNVSENYAIFKRQSLDKGLFYWKVEAVVSSSKSSRGTTVNKDGMRKIKIISPIKNLEAFKPFKPSDNYYLSKDVLLDFVNTRYHAYFHYNMCTFVNLNYDKKYGRAYGIAPPSMWNPAGLDTDQWAQVVTGSRMAGGWLTTKHHGGFCLWDSKYTDYDVASSPVKTDVVGEFVKSFRKAGLKVGLYYSILDYHHGIENGNVSREEIDFIKAQLTELLTNYGPIDYMNFDGWSSWPTTPDFDDIHYFEIFETVKSIQPECLIISHTYESNLAHSEVPFADAAGRPYPYHRDYMRPTAASDFLECDWWWDDQRYGVRKSTDYILKQLNSYNSHNSVYVLNISPNPAGRIEEAAIKRLKEAADAWRKPADLKQAPDNWGYQYDVNRNLAFGRKAMQSSTHESIGDKRTSPRADIALDGVLEGNLMMEQTSYTNKDMQAWWKVDLQEDYKINKITIYNRTDDDTDRLKDYWVYVISDGGEVVWKSYQTDSPAPSVMLKTGGVEGRFVKIQIDRTDYLHIAEVIVE